jgi:hypothetical protein
MQSWRRGLAGGFVAGVLAAGVLAATLAACTGDGDDDDRGSGPGRSDAAPAVRMVTLNVLHGLFCAAETDFCRAPQRAEVVADALERADCPELVGFQEVGPRQEAVVPAAMDVVCEGSYELAWEAARSPDRAMVFTTLPIEDRSYLDLAAFPWEAYRVRVDSPLGPLDFLTTHFASSSNNPPCTPGTAAECPPACPPTVDANRCNAIEVRDFMEANRAGAALQVVTGDLNAPPGSATLATFTDAGFEDAWVVAGRPECDPASGRGCTSDRPRPENALDGLDVPEGRYTERIDFVLARPGEDCTLRATAAPFLAEPLPAPVGGLSWASDHAGVLAVLRCA